MRDAGACLLFLLAFISCPGLARAQLISLIPGCSIISQLFVPKDGVCLHQAEVQAAADWSCGTAACNVNQLTDFLNLSCFCPPGGGDAAGPSGNGKTCGDPVDMATGIFTYDHTDLALADVSPLELRRSYRQNDKQSRAFGVGMSDNYDIWIESDANGGWTSVNLVLPNATRIPYQRTSSGTDMYSAAFKAASSPGVYFASTISFNGAGWTLQLRDGTQMLFGPDSLLSSISDRNDNAIQLQRGSNLELTQIASPNGRWIALSYDHSGRVYRAEDNAGRTTWYMYDSNGHLAKYYDAKGGLTSYAYDSSGRMVSYTTPNGNVHGSNQYDANSRVIQQTQPDGGKYDFSYLLDGNGNVTETDMTDPRGSSCNLTFDSNGYSLSDTWAVGKPEQQATTYNRDSNTELVNSTTDTLGRTTAYTYDAMGNVTSVTKLSGTSQAVTASLTYDPNFSQITSVTDPLGHVWTVGLDAHGNATSITDPLSHQATLTYNAAGQVASIADAVGDAVNFGYSAGQLTSITDPLGKTTNIVRDGVDQPASVSDPLGNQTSYTYDLLGDLTRIIDANGGATSFAYDGDGNLTSVTDANGNTTAYAYDPMDRRVSRTDALGHAQTYQYDGNGNLLQFTDRKGNVTKYAYDSLDRRIFAGFGYNSGAYQSTINYTYDGGDRLTEAVDSIAGTIARSYDGLDRLTDEQTPQGAVSYTYDAAGRRTSMTVVGQGAVAYAWDNANRLTGITQGSSSVAFSYDNANRRATLTLPNGVTVTYGYDGDSRIAQIAYGTSGSGSADVGALTYAYDADGRLVTRGGTLATTGMPASVSGNTFNADNEMTGFKGQALSYDLNGNLTGDGTNTYAWDARNHLTAIAGAVGASFVYDALGRRAGKTMAGATSQFLYDGLNPVQELDGATPPNVTANLLTGLGVDERFARTDSAGAANFLTDNLGGTIALAGSGGSLLASYTYEPFGNVTAGGSESANSYQFTGRENDGTGLYFYRARYYSPTYQRFISQDPIGFAGGDANLYGYVRESPLNDIDATGLCGDHPCFGWARQLQGNLGTVGHAGAFGTAVPAEGADIDPAQWGGKGAVGAIRGGVSGVVGPWNFNGIGDVIGGPFGSPVPGMDTRQGLESLNPGLLLIELPGAPLDLGVVPVVLMLPDGVPCPIGTVPAE